MYIDKITLQEDLTADSIKALPEYEGVMLPVPFIPPEDRYAVIFPAPKPDYDDIRETVRRLPSVLTVKGHYEQQWEVVALSAEQIAANEAAARKTNNDGLLAQILVLQNKALRAMIEDAPETTWLDIYKGQIAELRGKMQ